MDSTETRTAARGALQAPPPQSPETVRVRASTMMDSEWAEDVFDGTSSASDVAHSMASALGLPENVPYGLRSNDTGEFFADDAAIASYMDEDGLVAGTVTPRAHLG